MIKWFSVFLLLIAVVSCKSESRTTQKAEVWQESVSDGAYLALDVRTIEEVTKNPAAGSLNIPMDKLLDKLSELDKSKQVLIFCESGGRASQAQRILGKNGFLNIKNIGSWRDWNSFYKNKK